MDMKGIIIKYEKLFLQETACEDSYYWKIKECVKRNGAAINGQIEPTPNDKYIVIGRKSLETTKLTYMERRAEKMHAKLGNINTTPHYNEDTINATNARNPNYGADP